MRKTYLHLLSFLVVIMTVTACVIQKNPVSGNTRAYAYSWDQEIQIGREADAEISDEFGLYDDEEVRDYVVGIGESVLEVSHLRRPDTDSKFRETEFYFRVLDSPVINAFALPGGYVYMTRGLMAHLNNEAQFSVVMGHEIGHVAARHSSQRALRQTWGQLAVIGGAVIGQEVLGLPGQTLLDLSSTAAQLIFLSYSRENERESDQLGVEYAAMKQYVAAEGAAFFTSLKRISEQQEQSIPNLLSTHPDPGEREETIPDLAMVWEERGYEQTILNQDRYMEIIDGMIYGENPRNGFEREDIFYHPDLALQFSKPEGWQLVNQPSQVVMISPNEDAISIFRIDGEAETPQASVQSVLSQEGIEAIEEETMRNASGMDAYLATATASLEDGTPVTLHISALSYDDRIYSFLSYTLSSEFPSYEGSFNRILDSFDELTDPDILGIQPVRIRAFRADRSGPFSSFLPNPLPMDIEPQEIVILNQVEMDEEIQQGQWLKMPVQ